MTNKLPAPPMLESKQDRRRFTEWLIACGSTVHEPTNKYELLRFTTTNDMGIIYRNKHGSVSSMIGGAEEAWKAFCENSPWKVYAKTERRTKGAARRLARMRSIVRRDGWACIYCGELLAEDTATIEHVVSLSGAGKDNLFNMSLACERCNKAVGNMTVKQKIDYAVAMACGRA